jgi:hypothetical protein
VAGLLTGGLLTGILIGFKFWSLLVMSDSEGSEEVTLARDSSRAPRETDLTHEFPTQRADLSIVFDKAEEKLSLNIKKALRMAIILSALSVFTVGIGLTIGTVRNFALNQTIAILGAVVTGASGSSAGFFLSSRTERQERARIEALQVRLQSMKIEEGLNTKTEISDQEQASGES